MTPEERLTRIEEGWLELQRGHREIQQSQKVTDEAIASLARTVDKFTTGWQERMERIEANLELLIQAITAEHSNGKGNVQQ